MYKRSRKTISLLVVCCFILLPQSAYALPQGGVVTEGAGTIPTSAPGDTVLTVTQTSDRMIADWNSFDIYQQEIVNFNQPGS
ncbi:MAG: hypothetical protein MIO92_12975, partial [Methanosarcinaceae archaeon]|nr:hypothetical protein [Methanosarcinaceae archaeon]